MLCPVTLFFQTQFVFKFSICYVFCEPRASVILEFSRSCVLSCQVSYPPSEWDISEVWLVNYSKNGRFSRVDVNEVLFDYVGRRRRRRDEGKLEDVT